MAVGAFEPGRAYWFISCNPGAGKFLAVAAGKDGDEATFVRPYELLSGTPRWMDGRETVVVKGEDGNDYFASSASVENISAAARVIEEIKKARGEK